jgi:hypothetical protein
MKEKRSIIILIIDGHIAQKLYVVGNESYLRY